MSSRRAGVGASELRPKLVAIFSEIFQTVIAPNVEDISSENIPAWDSINKLRLVLELEQSFDITLSDDEVLSLESLQQAERLLSKRGL